MFIFIILFLCGIKRIAIYKLNYINSFINQIQKYQIVRILNLQWVKTL